MKKLFLLIIIFTSINIFAEERNAEERNIDINECINIALQNHPSLFIQIEDFKKSIANYRIAKSQKTIIVNGELKTIEFVRSKSTANTNFQIPGKDTDIGLFAGITMTYNLYDARKDYTIDIAKNNIDISKLQSQKVSNDVILQVKNAYYEYLISKNTLKIREEINQKYKNKSDLAKLLFEQGTKPILDVSKAEVDLADSQLQYERAKNNERKTKLNLFYSMGLEEIESITINPKDVETIPELKYSIDDLYKMAELYSPAIRMITLEKRTARLRISEENAAHFPRVDILFGVGYQNEYLYGLHKVSENFNMNNWSPAFNAAMRAAIPIYSGGMITARVDSAESDYNKIIYREKELLIDTKNRIRDHFRSLEEIKKQIEISNLIIKNAQRHLLLAQRSYESGVTSQLELQDAELSVINAEIGYLGSKYNYFLTLSRLSSLIGIGENLLCKNIE
ncbi:MAG: TolC family protein [Leptospirales bacterium]|nr:TolC family protein [Leptospirales bacterium]